MKAILNMLPLLVQSTIPATVVSVYASGLEAKLYQDDLSLRNLEHYSYSQARSHMVYLHAVFFEKLAEQNPGKLRLVHIFPGLVQGPSFDGPDNPAWFRFIWKWIVVPVFGRWILVPAEESGQRMLSLASPLYPPGGADKSSNQADAMVGMDGKPGSGAYGLTWNGENNTKPTRYAKMDKSEFSKQVWEHTNKAFEVIKAGQVFTE
jgi:hypothetical protein